MKHYGNYVSRFEYIYLVIDWQKLKLVMWYHRVRHHNLFRHHHCDESDCNMDLVLCLHCDNKILGWIDKEIPQ